MTAIVPWQNHDDPGRAIVAVTGEVLPPDVIRIPAAQPEPAQTWHETRTPRRDPGLESDVIVPGLQAVFTALAAGIGAALLAWALSWSWRVPVIVLALALIAAWAWRLRLTDRLLWQIETWTGQDLNQDGATGKPAVSFAVANPAQARAAIAQETRQAAQLAERETLLRFVDTCFVMGTSESAQGIAAGDRADYVRMRDTLLSLGAAKWKNPSRPKAGWVMAVSRERARQIIAKHVL